MGRTAYFSSSYGVLLGVAAAASASIAACGDPETTAGGGSGATTSRAVSSVTSAASTSGDGATTTSVATSVSSGSGGESPGPERAPGMTDLSILFPLPASPAESDLLLAPSDVGGAGELLPFATYEALPALQEEEPGLGKAEQYGKLRVVAARLDPCFPAISSPPEACRRQLRLVMQPGTADAAVHLFYELEEAAFTGLLGDVTRAQTATDAEGPLRVHPAMARDGLSGASAQEIRAAILGRAGEARLSRVTFMTVSGKGNQWHFGGFEIAGGQMTPISIVGSGATEQVLSNNAIPDHQDFRGSVFPVIQPDDLSAFYDSEAARALTEDALWPSYEAALRVQHPAHHTAESVSCAACHTADSALAWADRNTDLATRPTPLRFESTLDLTPPSDVFAERSDTVRAFGYAGITPAVSHRTIFETAVLVAHVRELYGF